MSSACFYESTDLLPYVEKAAELIGADPATIGITPRDFDRSVAIMSGAEGTVSHLTFASYRNEEPVTNKMKSLANTFGLRGLLRHDRGRFTVTAKGKWQTFEWPRDVIIETISSPQRINDIQAAIGIVPGQDAYILEETEGQDHFYAEEYLTLLAAMRNPIADRSHWITFKHDIAVNDIEHGPDIISRSPELVRAISAEAKKRLEKMPPGEATEEMKDLVKVEDDFRTPRSIFKAVHSVASPTLMAKSPLVTIHGLVRDGLNDPNDPEDKRQENYQARLAELGIMEKGLAPDDAKEASSLVTAGLVVHAAKVMLGVDELVPNPIPTQRAAHRSTWQRLVDIYS